MAITQRTQLTQPRPDLAVAFMDFDLEADRMGFVGHRILPVIEVTKSFGQYPRIELRDLLGSEETRRAADGSYNSVTIKGTKGSYRTEEYGLESPVDANDDFVYEDWWDAEMVAAMISKDRTLRAYEQRAITLGLTASNTNAAGTVWSTAASATPYANVLAAKIAVRNRTGIVPDSMVCEWEAFEYLRNTADMKDRIFGSVNPENAAQASVTQVAAALGLRNLFISGGVKNSANEGQAASIAGLWDRTKALVFKGGEEGGRISDLVRPRFGCTFHWGEDGSQIGGMVEQYEAPNRRSTIIRNRMQVDEVLLYNGLANIITGVLA